MPRSIRIVLLVVMGAGLALPAVAGEAPLLGSVAFASVSPFPEQRAIQKTLENYVRAVESRDLTLFKAVKPNLSAEEEQRVRRAFDSLQSQKIDMTIQSADVRESEARVRVSRRDTINSSIVSSFPQTFTLLKGKDGWTIQAIGR